MRKFLLLFAAATMSLSAVAEGLPINNLSARQSGMAGVGTGMNLGAESVWFNPAAVVMQNSLLDVSAGFTGIRSTVNFNDGNRTATTDNPLSMPFFAYASVRPIKWLAVGVAVNTPQSSSIDWGDSWSGANLCQSAALQQYNIQPTLSIRLGEHLSIGAGLMVAWGDFSFSRSILPIGNGALDYNTELGDLSSLGNNTVSLQVGGASHPALGLNAGIFWEPNKIFSFGVSYRHQITMQITEGSAELRYADSPLFSQNLSNMFDKIVGAGGEALSDVKVATNIVTPGVISAGLSIHPLNIIELAADVQYNLWSSYKDMSITLNSAAGSMDVANSASDKSYKNSFTGRVGLQVSPLGWLAARAGIYYDQSPVREGEMSPAMPSMSKLGLTAGLSLRFLRLIHLDLAYGYAAPFGGGRTDFAEYIHNFTQEVKTFGGTYSSETHSFSVGLRVSF